MGILLVEDGPFRIQDVAAADEPASVNMALQSEPVAEPYDRAGPLPVGAGDKGPQLSDNAHPFPVRVPTALATAGQWAFWGENVFQAQLFAAHAFSIFLSCSLWI